MQRLRQKPAGYVVTAGGHKRLIFKTKLLQASTKGANHIVAFLGPAPAWRQVPLCSGARCPLGPIGLDTPAQR